MNGDDRESELPLRGQLEQLRAEHDDALAAIPKLIDGARRPLLEEIERLTHLLERAYKLAVGHGPDFEVFDSWEEAISAYEDQRNGRPDLDEDQAMAIAVAEVNAVRRRRNGPDRDIWVGMSEEERRAVYLAESDYRNDS